MTPEADLAMLLAESHVEKIGRTLEPGTTAAVLVWENTWAAPFLRRCQDCSGNRGSAINGLRQAMLAIAPVAGLGRVVAAAPDMATALGYDVAATLQEPDDH
jgi:hypothetical protein